jgi:hypothetical protein
MLINREEMNVSVSVVFPEELLVAAREDREQFAREVTIYTVGHLYCQGKISSGVGARVLGCDRWEFYRLLTDYGFSVMKVIAGATPLIALALLDRLDLLR